WVAINPTRVDARPGSFKVNMTTGRWSDFATADAGGDLISLAAYLFKLKQSEAAGKLGGELGGGGDEGSLRTEAHRRRRREVDPQKPPEGHGGRAGARRCAGAAGCASDAQRTHGTVGVHRCRRAGARLRVSVRSRRRRRQTIPAADALAGAGR